MKHCHVVTAEQFERLHIEEIFRTADGLNETVAKNGGNDTLGRKLAGVIFYQPSTRTSGTFVVASQRLGMRTFYTPDAATFSSATKGESLEHTIRVLGGECMCDLIVLRHPADDAAVRAASLDVAPIINAGSGKNQHPTQALVDLYTIRNEIGRLEGLHVAMVGDLTYGRTVRSLAHLLAKFPGNRITFVSPPELRMRTDIKAYLLEHNVPYDETEDLAAAMRVADVVYHTRIQEEWFRDEGRMDLYEKLSGRYVITPELMNLLKPDGRLMHPMPIKNEILPAVDDHPQTAYFKQATKYAVPVRMALLTLILGPNANPTWGWRKP
ncbi:MAG: aspartate carbamoyltransferase [Patescibacteria group bacterium]